MQTWYILFNILRIDMRKIQNVVIVFHPECSLLSISLILTIDLMTLSRYKAQNGLSPGPGLSFHAGDHDAAVVRLLKSAVFISRLLASDAQNRLMNTVMTRELMKSAKRLPTIGISRNALMESP